MTALLRKKTKNVEKVFSSEEWEGLQKCTPCGPAQRGSRGAADPGWRAVIEYIRRDAEFSSRSGGNCPRIRWPRPCRQRSLLSSSHDCRGRRGRLQEEEDEAEPQAGHASTEAYKGFHASVFVTLKLETKCFTGILCDWSTQSKAELKWKD